MARKVHPKTLEEEEFQKYDFPKTPWHSICIKQCTKVDGNYRFFFRHWEIHFTLPFLFLSLVVYTFTIYILANALYLSKNLKIISIVEISIFLILFLINYISAICMDPGFLPFYWPAIPPSARKFKYSWDEQLTYLAINDHQFEIASLEPVTDSENSEQEVLENDENQDLEAPENDDPEEESINDSCATEEIINNPTENPAEHTFKFKVYHSKLGFASFSKSSGRFVIRADHICGWIGNWVGKRNHKQFILFTFYASLFFASMAIWRLVPKPKGTIPLKSRSKALYTCDIVAFAFDIAVTVMLVPFCINQVVMLGKGLTQLQRMRTRKFECPCKGCDTNKCMSEMRQVCGNGNVICWICPTPAFGDDLYIEGYT